MLWRPRPLSMWRTSTVWAYGVERAVGELGAVAVAEVGGAAAVEADVVEVLVPAEELEELDGLGGPAGHVARRAARAPPPCPCGVGTEACWRPALAALVAAGARTAEAAHADEVADVGDDPVLARLDEPVVAEAVDVGGHADRARAR